MLKKPLGRGHPNPPFIQEGLKMSASDFRHERKSALKLLAAIRTAKDLLSKSSG